MPILRVYFIFYHKHILLNYYLIFTIKAKIYYNQTMDSQTAKKIKNKDTQIEKILAKAMCNKGLRYRKNCKTVYGKPDFCFKGKKVAVFCDSEFWHGKKFLNGETFKTNKEFWEDKIMRNIERDIRVNIILQDKGWTVLRFWGSEIKNETSSCVEKIIKVLQ